MNTLERKRNNKPINVVIPAYNEEKHIEEVVNLLGQLELNLKVHVIDDGSKDATGKIARKAGAVVTRHPVNLGQWAAMRTGFTISSKEGADIVVSVDADGQHDPRDLSRLVEPILDGRADIVIGSRFFDGEPAEMPRYRNVGIKFFNKMIEIVANKELTDCTSGYRACNMEIIKKIMPYLTENQYGALEFVVKATRQGARIIEKPVRMRNNGVSHKGKVKYGYNLLRTILKSIIH